MTTRWHASLYARRQLIMTGGGWKPDAFAIICSQLERLSAHLEQGRMQYSELYRSFALLGLAYVCEFYDAAGYRIEFNRLLHAGLRAIKHSQDARSQHVVDLLEYLHVVIGEYPRTPCAP